MVYKTAQQYEGRVLEEERDIRGYFEALLDLPDDDVKGCFHWSVSRDYSDEFSSNNCELCGQLPGRRWKAQAINIHTELEDCPEYEICDDCRIYVTYGDIPVDLE